MLLSIKEANELIQTGAPLAVAGSRQSLAALVSGNWIGGSIPYFMTEKGGLCDRSSVFVDSIKLPWSAFKIANYDPTSLNRLATDAFTNGFTYVILPANSDAHLQYAMNAPDFPDIFLKPVIGWIAGLHLDDLASDHAAVFDGRLGAEIRNGAVALHIELPDNFHPFVRTLNLFQPGQGPAIRFSKAGFEACTAKIGGKDVNFAAWLQQNRQDAAAPLVADYAGTAVNVSIKAIDAARGKVDFYAPVFPGVDYHVAASVGDYVENFNKLIPKDAQTVVSCNCILNYLFGKLEGRRTGGFTGPITFGEIAQQLLNQTLVYLDSGKAP